MLAPYKTPVPFKPFLPYKAHKAPSPPQAPKTMQCGIAGMSVVSAIPYGMSGAGGIDYTVKFAFSTGHKPANASVSYSSGFNGYGNNNGPTGTLALDPITGESVGISFSVPDTDFLEFIFGVTDDDLTMNSGPTRTDRCNGS